MSKVKLFNLRFRARHYAGDPKMRVKQSDASLYQQSQDIDPRQTEGFKEIDHLVHSFVDSFPRDFKDPVKDGVVDTHLLIACISPNVYVHCFQLVLVTNADVAVKSCCMIHLPICSIRAVNQ